MLRWLGEIIWFPQAALSSRIAWSPVHARAAQATLTAGGQRAAQSFVVDLEGHPVEQRADRFNDSQKAILPWFNRNDEFGEFHGIRVPVQGEALRKYESGDFPYIRWRIAALDFDVPSRLCGPSAGGTKRSRPRSAQTHATRSGRPGRRHTGSPGAESARHRARARFYQQIMAARIEVVAGVDFDVAARRDARPTGTERRRKDDDDLDRVGVAGAGRGRGPCRPADDDGERRGEGGVRLVPQTLVIYPDLTGRETSASSPACTG